MRRKTHQPAPCAPGRALSILTVTAAPTACSMCAWVHQRRAPTCPMCAWARQRRAPTCPMCAWARRRVHECAGKPTSLPHVRLGAPAACPYVSHVRLGAPAACSYVSHVRLGAPAACPYLSHVRLGAPAACSYVSHVRLGAPAACACVCRAPYSYRNASIGCRRVARHAG